MGPLKEEFFSQFTAKVAYDSLEKSVVKALFGFLTLFDTMFKNKDSQPCFPVLKANYFIGERGRRNQVKSWGRIRFRLWWWTECQGNFRKTPTISILMHEIQIKSTEFSSGKFKKLPRSQVAGSRSFFQGQMCLITEVNQTWRKHNLES